MNGKVPGAVGGVLKDGKKQDQDKDKDKNNDKDKKKNNGKHSKADDDPPPEKKKELPTILPKTDVFSKSNDILIKS